MSHEQTQARQAAWSVMMVTCQCQLVRMRHRIQFIISECGHAELVLDSVGKCDVDVRRDLYSGIILTGMLNWSCIRPVWGLEMPCKLKLFGG